MKYSLSILIITLHIAAPIATYGSDEIVAKFSTSNIEPWGYINQSGQLDGLLIEVSDALQKETNITIKNKILPYPRVINNIKRGKVDFAIMFNSPEAREIGISIGKVVDTKIVLIALKGTAKATSLDQLKGQYVGYLNGSKYGEVFDNNENFTRVPLESLAQGIKMLLKNRLHAVATTKQTFYYALNKLNISEEKITSIFTITNASGDLYFSKASKNTHLIEPFRQAIKTLNEKGTLFETFHKNDSIPES